MAEEQDNTESIAVETEEWRDVPGWAGMYQASSIGRVRSVDRLSARGDRLTGRLMTPSLAKAGYHYYRFQLGTSRHFQAHRLVLLAFVGPPPDGHECRHLDGNKTNNRLGNLRWGTPKENGEDRVRHGTVITPARKGGLHHNARLTHAHVAEIRRILFSKAATARRVAVIFGMSDQAISDIRLGRRWT